MRCSRRTKGELHVGEGWRMFWNVRVMRTSGRVPAALGTLRHGQSCSVMVSSTSSMLSGEIDFWVHNALRILLARLRLVLACCMMDSYHVACQCVVA
jgi:hypothetical protein